MSKSILDYLDVRNCVDSNKVALKDETNQLTFSQLYNASWNLAFEIWNISGNIKNKPIIVFLGKSVEQYVALIGVLRSGNFYAPLDTKMPKERLRAIVKTLDSELIITDRQGMNVFSEIGFLGKYLIFEEINTLKHSVEGTVYNIDVDPAYILFTSGSTGTPKGVLVSHRAVIDYIEWQCKYLPIDSDSVLGNQAPFYFDASMPDIFTPLVVGATLIIIPERLFKLPSKLLEYIENSGINTLIWVPSALINLSQYSSFGDNVINQLRLVMFCGEVMPNKHLNIWRKNYPNAMFVNLYGPTEAAYACTYYVVKDKFKDEELLPIGKACENTEVLILDEGKLINEANVEGELCVRGSCLAFGYYNEVEKTRKSFVQNPCVTGYNDLIYKTGDIVKYNEKHEIVYVGRKDFQVKHNGYRIELGEIEAACYKNNSIEQACAIYDNVEKKIILFTKFNNTSKMTEREIYIRLKGCLPQYMLPAKIVVISEFPLNQNGKIDRKELLSIYKDTIVSYGIND